MDIELFQFNAILLESKLELTMMLLSLREGENIEDRILRLIGTLEEFPYPIQRSQSVSVHLK